MRIKNFGLCLFLVTTVAIKIVSCDAPSIWDVLPIASQVKSLFQLITLDPSGAAKTQMNFLNEGIGPAQARSAFFLATGEPKKALDIQGKCFSNLEGLVDGAPVIGHIKGGIHLLAGDHDHGMSAIKSATSTTGTLLGGALLGPMGAVGAHLLTDTAITVADVFINGNKSQPHGTLAYFKDFGKMNAGQHFDALAGVAFDGWTGIKVKTQTRAHETRQSYNPRKMGKKDTTRYAALLQDSDDSIELEEIPHSPKLTEGSEGSSGTISKFERSPELPEESSDIIKETKIDKNTDESIELKEIPHLLKLTEGSKESSESIFKIEESPELLEESSDVIEETEIDKNADESIELEEIPHLPKSTEGSEGSSGAIFKIEESPELQKGTSDFIEETKIDKLKKIDPYRYNNNKRLYKFFLFLRNYPNYAVLDSNKFSLKDFDENAAVELNKFADTSELKNIDVKEMANKLIYLSENEKSLITADDFRLVNKGVVEDDSLVSAIAGVLRKDVMTVHKMLLEEPAVKDDLYDYLPYSHITKLQRLKYIKYSRSKDLSGVKALSQHLKIYRNKYEGRESIVTVANGNVEKNAVVMKLKFLDNTARPVKLYIDYTVPAFLKKDIPNPFRFTSHLNDPTATFRVYLIEELTRESPE